MLSKEHRRAQEIALRARTASKAAGEAAAGARNSVIQRLAASLEENAGEIINCNREDVRAAKEKNLPAPLVERLVFDDNQIKSRVVSLLKIASLPDPLGRVFDSHRTENGMTACKIRTPLGVILLIYEARPHVAVNSGALALKSGNAIILKGGKEARHTNACLGNLWKAALSREGLPETAVQVAELSHAEVDCLLEMHECINLVVPRGGKKLIESVAARSRIPVIKHFEGICHVYIGEGADPEQAASIAMDSKLLMPAVCNAAETLLIDKSAAGSAPGIIRKLLAAGIRLRGCPDSRKFSREITPAEPGDWRREYLDTVYSVRVVDGITEAINHINENGSGHTDAIVTGNYYHATRFVREVDSAVVLVNASTMFCDGETLGMGAEIGISTDKIHARGPMGLNELTTYKHVVMGEGQVMGTD